MSSKAGMYGWYSLLWLVASLCGVGCAGSGSATGEAVEEEGDKKQDTSVVVRRPAGVFGFYYDSCCYQLSWSQLALVDYEERVVPEADMGVLLYPLFSDSLRLLDGCLVELGGYALPLEETGMDTILILSAFPYTQCFFCGNAGPESVAEVVWRRERAERLPMDERIRVRGPLHLNDQDPEHMQYQLKEAELLTK